MNEYVIGCPLTATPLADRIAELEADRARLEAAEEDTLKQVAKEYHGRITAEAERDALRREVEQLGVSEVELLAERDALRAELRELREVAERNVGDVQHLRQSAIALTDERDALRAQVADLEISLAARASPNRTWHAQVEAVRALCARFERGGGTLWPGEVLAAIDGTKP